jgi:predicted DCC family thiol-disulfide oxidoreductase YuxK
VHVSATFLYDGDCAFCSTCARFIERRLRPDAEVVAWQWADLDALGTTREAAEEAVQWIDGGRVEAGPDAISRLLRASRWYWRPAGWVLAIPVVRWPAWPVYRWISRNRDRLPGGTPACALPQAHRDRLRASGASST